jgi:hypothetical protein
MLAGRPHEAAGNGSPRWMAAGPRSRGCTEPGLQAGSPLTPALACGCAFMIVPWRTSGAPERERTSHRARRGRARWHRGTDARRCPSSRRSSRARAAPGSPSGAARPRSGSRRRSASSREPGAFREFRRLHRFPPAEPEAVALHRPAETVGDEQAPGPRRSPLHMREHEPARRQLRGRGRTPRCAERSGAPRRRRTGTPTAVKTSPRGHLRRARG